MNIVYWKQHRFANITDGAENSRFSPDSGIPRGQFAVLAYYLKGCHPGENADIPPDRDAPDRPGSSYPAFRRACGTGIWNGNSGNIRTKCPRAQAAAIPERLAENAAADTAK